MRVRTGLVGMLLLVLLLSVGQWTNEAQPTSAGGTPEEAVLYQEDFEDGQAQGWNLQGNWQIVQDTDGNRVLRGRAQNWAAYTDNLWWDYSVEFRVKLTRGRFGINYRVRDCYRYFVRLDDERLLLGKTSPCNVHQEMRVRWQYHSQGRWHKVKVFGRGGKLEIYVNGMLLLSFLDPQPLVSGTIGLETFDDSEVYVDDIVVKGPRSPSTGLRWVRTGGPPGGIGYDIRMRPDNPDILYVTDALAGVHKSSDGGRTWVAMNTGINARVGPSGDAIPVFCLTIDPNDPNIIWIGLQGIRGIYRSADGGQSWEERVRGIIEDRGLTVRGIAIEPGNSNIVYAAAEISSDCWAGQNMWGRQFDRVKGVVYKSTDAGVSWTAIWRGDNLARYVLINPTDVRTIYVSTGIFDREAANSDPKSYTPGGVGILKTTDGGKTWVQVNKGLQNLYIGTLFMHPDNPSTLLAGAGNVTYSAGEGVYLSTDGAASWQLVARGRMMSVEFSLSNPNVVYAGGDSEFYRSLDGGRTWHLLVHPWGKWGPLGLRPGLPIDFQVDPRDPMRIFVNNYGGGNSLSIDGGLTWVSASDGYTGAELTDVAVHPKNPDIVFANGRNGPFKSLNGGGTWNGMNPGGRGLPAIDEGARVAIDPHNPDHIIVSATQCGWVCESHDGGVNWKLVIDRHDELLRDLQTSDDNQRFQGMWAIAFAPSKKGRVYGGWGIWRCATDAQESLCTLPVITSILVSEDGGHTWTRRRGTALDGLTVPGIVVHPHDADMAWAATVGGGVFRTSDGGITWTPMSSGLSDKRVMALAIDPKNPDVLYAGTAGAAVFKTLDGGRSWRPSSAGMNPTEFVGAIVVDPATPSTIYAGSVSSGVFVSLDSGGQWHRIIDGLRTRAVSALAISSNGKVLYAATRGEGVFQLDLTQARAER